MNVSFLICLLETTFLEMVYIYLFVEYSILIQYMYIMYNDQIREISISFYLHIISLSWEPWNSSLIVVKFIIVIDCSYPVVLYNIKTTPSITAFLYPFSAFSLHSLSFLASGDVCSILYWHVVNYFNFHKWVRTCSIIFLLMPIAMYNRISSFSDRMSIDRWMDF